MSCEPLSISTTSRSKKSRITGVDGRTSLTYEGLRALIEQECIQTIWGIQLV